MIQGWQEYDGVEFPYPEINIPVGGVYPNRKVRAIWSMEAAQDLKTFHNLDAERELTKVLAQEILEEIDREVVRGLEQANPDNNGFPEII